MPIEVMQYLQKTSFANDNSDEEHAQQAKYEPLTPFNERVQKT